MRIVVLKGVIYAREDGMEDRPIGSVFPSATEMDEKVIAGGSEALEAVKNFVDEVNSGSFKPRAVVKDLERILDKYAV